MKDYWIRDSNKGSYSLSNALMLVKVAYNLLNLLYMRF